MAKVIFVTFWIFFGWIQNSFAQQTIVDVIYLKNGIIVRGQIIESIQNDSVKIKILDDSVLVFKNQDIEKIAKEPFNKKKQIDLKSPQTAACLSFVYPGLGQFYNGEIKKGIIQASLSLVGAVTYLWGFLELPPFILFDTTRYEERERKAKILMISGGTVSVVTLIWSMLDAVLSANRINRELNKNRIGNLFEFNKEPYVLKLDLLPKPQGMGMQFTFNF